MNRWAARYGFEKTGREILDKAKKGNNGRYAAVNLMNYSTIEFRMFRGTLKYNTFIAVLELVNAIIDAAIYNTDDTLSKLSWLDFVSDITEPELIQYLKERKLYVNDDIADEKEEILKTVLPLYLGYYKIAQKYDLSDYKDYRQAVDSIREASGIEISRNGFDHLLWYYHKGRI